MSLIHTIHAVRSESDPDGREHLTRCEDNDPARVCFGLYRQENPDDLPMWVSDHPTRKEAKQKALAETKPR